jgi:magnesium-transporting ATPase (P-type)
VFLWQVSFSHLFEIISTSHDEIESAATEKAMIKFIMRCGYDFKKMRKAYLPEEHMRFMFDSARKRMSTIMEIPTDENYLNI